MADALCYLYKVVNKKQPSTSMISFLLLKDHRVIKVGCIYEPFYRNASFENYFLPYAINEWSKLDILKLDMLNLKLEMLKHMLPFEKCFEISQDPYEIALTKFMTR